MEGPDPHVKLTPGVGFHLGPEGYWKAEEIPSEAIQSATPSGLLTIEGQRCTVFDTKDGEWAQKSVIASRVAARWLRLSTKTLIFEMPSDQDWDSGYWQRVGVGSEWDKITADMEAAGATYEDTDDIILTCRDELAKKSVLDIIEQARNGAYGSDVQAYWKEAKMVPEENHADYGIDEQQTQQGQQTQQASSDLAVRVAARWVEAKKKKKLKKDFVSQIGDVMNDERSDTEYQHSIVNFCDNAEQELAGLAGMVTELSEAFVNAGKNCSTHSHEQVSQLFGMRLKQALFEAAKYMQSAGSQALEAIHRDLTILKTDAGG